MLGMSTTAHPKIDGKTGQMIIHGYQPFEPYLQYYVVEPDGTCSLAENVDAPYCVMAHDIAITENYAIFVWGAIHFDGMAIMNGGGFGEAISWKPELGLRFGVRRREAGAKTRWFTAPTPGYIFHPGNAYEENGKIMMDACTYRDGGVLLETLDDARDGRPVPGFSAVPFLYELDLATGVCSESQLDDRGAEFPRLDDRLVGYKNRYGYAALDRTAGGDPADTWATIVRYDRTGRAQRGARLRQVAVAERAGLRAALGGCRRGRRLRDVHRVRRRHRRQLPGDSRCAEHGGEAAGDVPPQAPHSARDSTATSRRHRLRERVYGR